LTSALTVLTGRDADVKIAATPALYFALAMVATPVMFLAVGALTSQLAATRRQAAAYASAFLGATYGMRMIADAGVGLHGLIWASPIGWVEELQPLTSPRPLALVPIVLFTSVLAITTVRLAEARDVGASILADHAGVRSHPSLLSSPMGLAARLARPAVVGWWITIGTAGLLYGLIAKSAGSTISGSSVRQVFTKLGARGSGSAEVLGVCFLFIAVLIAFVAAGQLSAARAEEAEGRLDNILVRPVARSSWLAGRLTISLGAIIASGVLAGLAAWLGEASQHAGVSFATMLDAGANVVPPAVAILGLGTLVFGISPRKTSVVTYAVLGWSLVVVIVGGIGAVNHWLLDTSVFHEMASAPAVAPRWQANAVMVGAGLVGACLGGLAFRRRDLKGE
jgi:ABC-2 type transport system permease protein